ncbi:MAG: hypothetical protein V9E99_04045 [Microthrixaceae bacterium]
MSRALISIVPLSTTALALTFFASAFAESFDLRISLAAVGTSPIVACCAA